MAEVDRAIKAVELRRKQEAMQAEISQRLWDAKVTELRRVFGPLADRLLKRGPR